MAMAKYTRKQESFLKRLGSRANSKMSQLLLGKPKEVVFSNFLARQNYICKAMTQYQGVYPYLEGLSLRVTNDIVFVSMEEHARVAGHSGYTIWKSFKLWTNSFTGFSTVPITIATFFAAVFFLVGVIILIFSLMLGLFLSTSLGQISVTLICTGAIMGVLGLVGEYAARSYITANRYPLYTIRRTINLERRK